MKLKYYLLSLKTESIVLKKERIYLPVQEM